MSLTSARIRALNAVLSEGGYSAAARRLKVSQPAISQAVRDLEHAFNLQLFRRRGQRLVPTELCLDLSEITAGIERLESEARLLLTRGEKLETGVLRIGLGSLMPGMALIGAFQKRFPKVQVEVEYAIHASIIDAVWDHRVDVGVLPNVPRDRRFHTQVCLEQDVVALLPVGHRLALAAEVSIADLASERLIFQKKGSATQKVVDAAFRRAGIAARPSLVLETGSEVFEAVVGGLGVGFLWRHGTSRRDGARRVRVAEVDETYEEVIFRRSDANSAIVDMFFATASSLAKTAARP